VQPVPAAADVPGAAGVLGADEDAADIPGTDEDATAADTATTVEAAGRFRIYLGAAAGVAAPLGIDVHVIALHKPPKAGYVS
jgi:hypothetical protein